MSNEVTFAYDPRDLFLDFHLRSERWALMIVHRRGGKTVACVADLILKAVRTQKTNARFGYVAPFRQQAKEIAWQYLKDMTEGLRSEPPRESELRVKLYNGAWVTLYGADNPDSLRGMYFDGIVLDEYGDMKPSLMGEVVLPALTDRKGWLVIIGTPKGRNQFHAAAVNAELSDEWFFRRAPASETGLIPDDDLAELRAQQTPEEYQQEMECSFDAAVKGTYYAQLINAAENDGRVVNPKEFELYDDHQKVNVVADLGYSDSSAWWFWQSRPDGFAMIDFYSASGKDLKHYLSMLHSKKYAIDTIWLPHDAKAKTLQTGLSTVEQILRPHNLLPDIYPPDARLPVRLVPKLSVQHGIDAVRMVLPLCYFDRVACFEGLEALRSYRRKWNETTQSFADKPMHDWASDPADAFRYFALVCRKTRGQSAEHHIRRMGGPKREDRSWTPTPPTLNQMWDDRESLNLGRRKRI
jgi:hypothetical protein